MSEEHKTTYGIVGNPLSHSLSPQMHNTAFKDLGVDAVYKLFPLKEDELKDFFQKLHDKDSPVFGLNVTIPYKETVIEYLDVLSPLAQKINAVNTVVITSQRKLIGYNTDAPGFLAHMAELKIDFREKRVAVLGAGGSCRAILTTLCMIPERPQSIRIYNRTSARINDLLGDIAQRIDTSIIEPVNNIDDLNIELADILINTTSVGLKGEDDILVDEDMLHTDMFVYDLIYNPKETELLKMAKRRGARTSNGLGMLYYQGVLSFQHWANLQLEEKTKKKMRDALENAIK
jgi:shikimate dehydrogenase